MLMILSLVSLVVGIGSLICWIMVEIKMFGDEENGGALKGIIGIVTCGIYALIWGWQNHEKHDNKQLMQIWTALFVLGIVINVLSRALA